MENQTKNNSRVDSSNGTGGNAKNLDAKNVNVDLLPLVHDIVRSLEKDGSDVSQRSRDSLEASQKIMELNKKVERVREDIYRLPGIEVNKEEQLAQSRNLVKQLNMKKDLIAKYKELNLKVNGLCGLHQSN
jgi:mediator of RNA polymerase II transcription subunit 9